MDVRGKLILPIDATHPLRMQCQRISQYYNGITYLVGSQVNPTVSTPRDVDLVCVIPDSEFERRYGTLAEWYSQVVAGLGGRVAERCTIDCNKRTRSVSVPQGMVDFKVLPSSTFLSITKLHYASAPPLQVDNRPPGTLGSSRLGHAIAVRILGPSRRLRRLRLVVESLLI